MRSEEFKIHASWVIPYFLRLGVQQTGQLVAICEKCVGGLGDDWAGVDLGFPQPPKGGRLARMQLSPVICQEDMKDVGD